MGYIFSCCTASKYEYNLRVQLGSLKKREIENSSFDSSDINNVHIDMPALQMGEAGHEASDFPTGSIGHDFKKIINKNSEKLSLSWHLSGLNLSSLVV